MINKNKNLDFAKSKKRLPYILGAIVAILGILYIAVELPIEQRFAVMDKEMEKVRQDVINPVSGVEIEQKGDKFTGELPYKRGNNWINGCSIDVHCPVISRAWKINIKPGTEHESATNLLTKLGYSVDIDGCKNLEANPNCGISGKRDNLDMSVNIKESSADNDSREVKIMLNYYWEKE